MNAKDDFKMSFEYQKRSTRLYEFLARLNESERAEVISLGEQLGYLKVAHDERMRIEKRKRSNSTHLSIVAQMSRLIKRLYLGYFVNSPK